MKCLSNHDLTTLKTTLTGTLYKGPPTTDPDLLFMSKTIYFNFRIISPLITNIVPPATIKDITYIVRDPKMIVPLGKFQKFDTDGTMLSMKFKLMVDGPGVVDDALIKESVLNGDNPTLTL
jgi:hypothetical protein